MRDDATKDSSLLVYEFVYLWGERLNLFSYSDTNHILTKGKPAVTSFPNMWSAALDYHTIHHLTHTAVTKTGFLMDCSHPLPAANSFAVYISLYTQPLLPITIGSWMYVERLTLSVPN
jgi:hypothetical protein